MVPPKSRWKALERGGLLLVFPGRHAHDEGVPVNHFVGSVGLIAKLAKVPVQTLIVETDSPYLSKGWPFLRVPALPITYRVRLGERFPRRPTTRVPSIACWKSISRARASPVSLQDR